jgi:microcystin degradation protein MlrC
MRVALMGIVHESNTFVDRLTTLEHFRAGHWLFGNDIISEYRHAFHEIGGMIEAMETAGIELVPVMYAEATPGGTVSADAFNRLTGDMFSALKKVLPVDGCLVVPHGAGVSEACEDMDGCWLEMLREIVGDAMPVIGTIDPHANVSRRMIDATQALVAYKTNPHVDQRSVGLEAGRLMAATLSGRIRPVSCFAALPLAISIEQQRSDKDPCRHLLQLAADAYGQPSVVSVSIVLGFPYADVPEMGSSIIVVTNNDPEAGMKVLSSLEAYVMGHRSLFNGTRQDMKELVGSIGEHPAPVLLLDMGDNVGGGSPGDSTYLLDRLDDAGKTNAFICIHDPEAVRTASSQNPDAGFWIIFGKDPETGSSRRRQAKLVRKGPGTFSEKAPRHGGQVHFDMGDIAILRTGEGQTVMLTSKRTAPFSLQQLIAFGLDPASFNFIVAKGVNAPIAAYRDVCPTILQVDTPGVTTADMTRFHHKKRRMPLYPFEDIEHQG